MSASLANGPSKFVDMPGPSVAVSGHGECSCCGGGGRPSSHRHEASRRRALHVSTSPPRILRRQKHAVRDTILYVRDAMYPVQVEFTFGGVFEFPVSPGQQLHTPPWRRPAALPPPPPPHPHAAGHRPEQSKKSLRLRFLITMISMRRL